MSISILLLILAFMLLKVQLTYTLPVRDDSKLANLIKDIRAEHQVKSVEKLFFEPYNNLRKRLELKLYREELEKNELQKKLEENWKSNLIKFGRWNKIRI